MTTTLETSYQPLQPFGPELGEGDETPQETGVMIHVVPESGKGKLWTLIVLILQAYHLLKSFKATLICFNCFDGNVIKWHRYMQRLPLNNIVSSYIIIGPNGSWEFVWIFVKGSFQAAFHVSLIASFE